MTIDLSDVYNAAITLITRFLNWSFVIWGVEIHVYSIVIFVFLALLFQQFISYLRGV